MCSSGGSCPPSIEQELEEERCTAALLSWKLSSEFQECPFAYQFIYVRFLYCISLHLMTWGKVCLLCSFWSHHLFELTSQNFSHSSSCLNENRSGIESSVCCQFVTTRFKKRYLEKRKEKHALALYQRISQGSLLQLPISYLLYNVKYVFTSMWWIVLFLQDRDSLTFLTTQTVNSLFVPFIKLKNSTTMCDTF